jgi:hypothetical protein
MKDCLSGSPSYFILQESIASPTLGEDSGMEY